MAKPRITETTPYDNPYEGYTTIEQFLNSKRLTAIPLSQSLPRKSVRDKQTKSRHLVLTFPHSGLQRPSPTRDHKAGPYHCVPL